MPGHRDERRPWARRHRHDRARLAPPATNGSVVRFSGIAGVPAGLPSDAGSSLNSNLGFVLATALLPEFSSAPPSIHLRITSISASGILGEFGGILGSSLCEITRKSVLFSASPGSITFPDPPPCIAEP